MCMMLHVVPCTSVSVRIVHVGGPRGVSENASSALHRRPCVMNVSVPERGRKLTFLSVTATYVHVHTYAHPENRSLIQSLVLMCLATTHCV